MTKITSGAKLEESAVGRRTSGYDLIMRPLERAGLGRLRRGLLAEAGGRVLELAVGSGVNLALHAPGACIVGVDLSREMLRHAAGRKIEECTRLVQADAERLPFGPAQFDTVISTLLYCSLDHPESMLGEIRRLLRPGGRLLMLEHVRGGSLPARLFTDLMARPWHAVTRSCRLNREPEQDLLAAGYRILSSERHAVTLFQTIVAQP
jgi:ubiquinone/menaquinone biosynthesis C-methylase UbiE